jgi:hypothetical protein
MPAYVTMTREDRDAIMPSLRRFAGGETKAGARVEFELTERGAVATISDTSTALPQISSFSARIRIGFAAQRVAVSRRRTPDFRGQGEQAGQALACELTDRQEVASAQTDACIERQVGDRRGGQHQSLSRERRAGRSRSRAVPPATLSTTTDRPTAA